MRKGAQVVEDIKKTTGNDKVEVMELDLTSLQSVRNFVDRFRATKLPIHVLICISSIRSPLSSLTRIINSAFDLGNAGIMACPYAKTMDGFESQFAVNRLAHFLLVRSLVPELEAGRPSRVVVVSSVANTFSGIHWKDIHWETTYDKWLAYGQSKTAHILFANQLNKLYASQGIQAHS